jgi:hypothetical protein
VELRRDLPVDCRERSGLGDQAVHGRAPSNLIASGGVVPVFSPLPATWSSRWQTCRGRRSCFASPRAGPTCRRPYRNGMLTGLRVSRLMGCAGGLQSAGGFPFFSTSILFLFSVLVC